MNYTNTSYIQSNDNTDSQIKNKGFLIIDSIFRENNWKLTQNDINYISYSKFGDETTTFYIKIFADKIVVSVPLKNSIYQYITSFNNYYDASEYIELQFLNYIM